MSSDLDKLVRLNEIWNEFLRRQDESRVDCLLAGDGRLAIVRDGCERETREPIAEQREPKARATADRPSRDPSAAARTLATVSSEHERRKHLVGYTVKQLRGIAKQSGLSGYSNLKRDELVDLLSGSGGSRRATADPAAAPSTSAPVREARGSGIDVRAIADQLRVTETESEGATYLEGQRLDRAGLLAVATELQMTRVERLSLKELKRRILKQAIGARRKFAGLRKW
ncbi:hypothetical protein GCM10027271_44810 [Saccharopolyspora gloriosae]|uniref:Rho termination factor N-terminal domain-containing protein n=1 Tax=Saccharopolyspora gloriosae TaxID=455344 RepID=A0A840NE67_9PSEU|nr:hypothetical protein [Saccharopolyspora gloriosae]MBB5070220.1 hypothetical protein [Saccharopolyspora gloriosae]